ncbi:unnamed protein product [Brassicogethes aeneus]|uniref:Uncharacterized protein n=1 Tax=Brassicogethes aeneus TaxID=1431903 RepID=A0A9P0BGB4_BRAAE|nr:unnamed protein product [Brassicogethes aeneus]
MIKKSLVHVVEQYMVNDVNNVSLGAATEISKQIVDEYPNSFKVKIGGQHLKGTAKSLAYKIYHRLHYNKKEKAERTLSLSYDVDDLDEPSAAPKAQDEYGCVAYL